MWSEARCRIAEQAYGQWLSYLRLHQDLDAAAAPEDRVTAQHIGAFINDLQSRIAPCSVAMMLGALQRMLEVMAPEMDWDWLKEASSDLKVQATPSRDKRAHMVSPEQLFELGIKLLTEARAEESENNHYGATKGRDGMIIALLICCPIRMANLLEIEVGRHLVFDTDRYLLRFADEETKTGDAYVGELPPELAPWIDEYLKRHRVKLLARAEKPIPTPRLWIDRWGKPMMEHSIRDQIEKRSRDAFGPHIWPHLFRAIAVTGLVDHTPEEIAIAADLLGHSTLQTTQKHYILAQGTCAQGRRSEAAKGIAL